LCSCGRKQEKRAARQRAEARTQGRWRVEVEGRVAGTGEAVGEARTQGRCRVTVVMVG